MSIRTSLVAAAVGAAGITLGWFAHQYYVTEPCAFMSQGYKSIRLNTHTLQRLPLSSIPEKVFSAVQQCWAAKPYAGPLHVLELVAAFETKSRDYYLAFEPSGVTDKQILFLVRRDKEAPVSAWQRSTL